MTRGAGRPGAVTSAYSGASAALQRGARPSSAQLSAGSGLHGQSLQSVISALGLIQICLDTQTLYQKLLYLPLSATKSHPGPSLGDSYINIIGCPHTALPFGKYSPFYFGEEKKMKTWPSQESTEAGRQMKPASRGALTCTSPSAPAVPSSRTAGHRRRRPRYHLRS